MSFKTRRNLIRKIEKIRRSRVLCYITSIRANAVGSMSDDAVREIIDHLLKMGSQSIQKLDLFIVSNGGDGVVPWRLVPIFREYAPQFSVLGPVRA